MFIIVPSVASYIILGAGFAASQKSHENTQSVIGETSNINSNDKTADIWYNKGVELCNLGKYDEGIEAFNQAIKRNPNDNVAWSYKAWVLFQI